MFKKIVLIFFYICFVNLVYADSILKLAIIIDDVTSIEDVIKFTQLKVPLNFAILPHQDHSKEANEYLKNLGYVTLLHIPMEGGNENLNSRTEGILKKNMSKEEIESTFKKAILSIGETKGCNNHMGSTYTKFKRDMNIFLDLVKNENMFYIDSHTTGLTIAYEMAKMKDIKTNRNRHFIDNEKNIEYSLQKLRESVEILKNRPDNSIIVIGHAAETTATAIELFIKELNKNEIELVFVDKILK